MKKTKIIKDALTNKRNEIIKALFKENYSYSDIAFMFNIAHTTVLRIIK